MKGVPKMKKDTERMLLLVIGCICLANLWLAGEIWLFPRLERVEVAAIATATDAGTIETTATEAGTSETTATEAGTRETTAIDAGTTKTVAEEEATTNETTTEAETTEPTTETVTEAITEAVTEEEIETVTEAETTEAVTEAVTEEALDTSDDTSEDGSIGVFKITYYAAAEKIQGLYDGGYGVAWSESSGAVEGRTVAMNAEDRKNYNLPYGSKIKIEGFDGVFVIEDCGCDEGVIDMFFVDYQEGWKNPDRKVWVVSRND